jgi:hypothetical protein
MESAFGMLQSEREIFCSSLNKSTDQAEDRLKVCYAIHNFVYRRDGYSFVHTYKFCATLLIPQLYKQIEGKFYLSLLSELFRA